MADDSQKMVTPPCVQCGREPVASCQMEPGGPRFNVCFEHLQQFEAMRLRQIELYREMADRAEDAIADAVGFPRPPRIPAPRVNVHQVNIHGDNLGVINTGTVGSLQNNLSIIHGQDAALAAKLKELTEAILASAALDAAQKQEAADLLNDLMENAGKSPKQRRAPVVMKSLANTLGRILSTSADLYTLWTALAPLVG